MATLSEIIKEDIRHVSYFAKGVVSGIIKGAYTPYLITTTIRQNQRRKTADLLAGEKLGHAIGNVSTHMFVSFPVIYYAFSQGNGKHYTLALLATNTLDYFYNLNQRKNL